MVEVDSDEFPELSLMRANYWTGLGEKSRDEADKTSLPLVR